MTYEMPSASASSALMLPLENSCSTDSGPCATSALGRSCRSCGTTWHAGGQHMAGFRKLLVDAYWWKKLGNSAGKLRNDLGLSRAWRTEDNIAHITLHTNHHEDGF
eukprot:353082-Chlamydomonas_euryale.AAC.23